MDNIGLICVRMECMSRFMEVATFAAELDYHVLHSEIYYDLGQHYISEIYMPQYPKNVPGLLAAYKLHEKDWGNDFGVHVIQHRREGTLAQFYRDQGHFMEYQIVRGNTFRGKFGLGLEFNIPTLDSHFTITFPAIHGPKTREDVIRHLRMFRLLQFIS